MSAVMESAEQSLAVEAELARIRREQHEDWLYFHLVCARNAARELDRLDYDSHEHRLKRLERERALAQASKHYLRLLDTGGVTPLLASMALAEGGLTP